MSGTLARLTRRVSALTMAVLAAVYLAAGNAWAADAPPEAPSRGPDCPPEAIICKPVMGEVNLPLEQTFRNWIGAGQQYLLYMLIAAGIGALALMVFGRFSRHEGASERGRSTLVVTILAIILVGALYTVVMAVFALGQGVQA